jgi:hypothetical protein
MSQLTRRLFCRRVRPVLHTRASGFTPGLTALRPTVVSTHKRHISSAPISILKSVWNGARGSSSITDKVSRTVTSAAKEEGGDFYYQMLLSLV